MREKKEEKKKRTMFTTRPRKGKLDFVSFQQPGEFDWKIPQGVYNLVPTVIGGGGGATATGTIDDVAGGAAGATCTGSVDVCPGEEVHITVGGGGAPFFSPTLPASPAGDGMPSTFRYKRKFITAGGGQGGQVASGISAIGGTCTTNVRNTYTVNGQDGGEFFGGSTSGGGNGGLG